ncbi:hypothetical protein GH141_06470 [bacterium]|nr:hypothetical protein [bacterium]
MHSNLTDGTIIWPVTHHDFSPGVYFLRVEDGSSASIQKGILIRIELWLWYVPGG